MSTFNRSIAFLALSLCGFLAAQQASADTKIGVVNFQKLLRMRRRRRRRCRRWRTSLRRAAASC